MGDAKRVLKVSELNEKEKVGEYQERITDEWSEKDDVEEEWQLFNKSAMVECTEKVCGMGRMEVG